MVFYILIEKKSEVEFLNQPSTTFTIFILNSLS